MAAQVGMVRMAEADPCKHFDRGDARNAILVRLDPLGVQLQEGRRRGFKRERREFAPTLA